MAIDDEPVGRFDYISSALESHTGPTLAAAKVGPIDDWPLILVGALIIGAQSDPSTLSLIPLSVIWLWWKRKQIKLSKKLVVGAIGLFLLAHATWFVFELRHDFLNTRAAVGLFSGVFKGPTLADAKARAYPDIQNDGRSSIPFILFRPPHWTLPNKSVELRNFYGQDWTGFGR